MISAETTLHILIKTPAIITYHQAAEMQAIKEMFTGMMALIFIKIQRNRKVIMLAVLRQRMDSIYH